MSVSMLFMNLICIAQKMLCILFSIKTTNIPVLD